MSDDAGGRGSPPAHSAPVIAGYRDLTEIGRGGYAIVYQANQVAMGRTVAVKVLARLDLSGDLMRRFRRECEAMGRLSWHPHIVVVYDAGETVDGAPYLAMEHLPGGSLGEQIRDHGPLPWTDVLAIGVQLADALAAAHGADVLHRDVKPENVLLDRFGESKLSDFGIAAVQGATTATTSITGTIAHAAPEILAGTRASVASDLYSLGSTLHTLLTGRPAFVRETDESFVPVAVRIANDPVPDLRPHGVPDLLAHRVEQAMAKSAADRPASAAAFARTLLDAQRQLGLPVSRTRSAEIEGSSPPLPPLPDATVVVDASPGPAAGAAPAPAVEPAPLFAPGTRFGSVPVIPPGLDVPVPGAVPAAAAASGAGAPERHRADEPPPTRWAPPVAPAPAYEHTAPAPAPVAPRPRRRSSGALVAVGIAVLVLGGVAAGATFLTGDDDDGDAGGAVPLTTTPTAASLVAAPTTAATAPTTAAPTVDPAVETLAAFPDRQGDDGLADIGVADDGTSWVSDFARAQVLHLDRDGTVLETFGADLVGREPARLVVADDGVWVVSQRRSVSHLRDGEWHPVDGLVQPIGITAAPGGGVWVTEYQPDAQAELRLLKRVDSTEAVVDDRVVGEFPFSVAAEGDDVFTVHATAKVVHRSLGPTRFSEEVVGAQPWDVLLTDDAVWVTSRGTDGTFDERGVARFDRATFGEDGGPEPATVDVGREPRYLWADPGGMIWVSVRLDDRVVRIDPDTLELAVFCTGPGSHPNGLTGDDQHVYVVTEGDGQVRTIPLGAEPGLTCPAPT